MIVQTKNGKLRGFERESALGGKKYVSFLGVPFAKPPVGDLRFSAPVPLEDWHDIYDATYERDQCCQQDSFLGMGLVGSDDCLHLNIHIPELNPSNLKPVLVNIHGGGFFCGTGHEKVHGADYLMHNDVILVSIHYRVHILGFLNLGIPECPGNAGLKDQVMALKWVKENIKAFGGDPDNITINGCSAGGSSVNFLMISPMAKGLFEKAISQSGTVSSSWAFTYDPIKWAFKAGRKLGFNGDDRLELLVFLKKQPVSGLAVVANQLFEELTEEYPARGVWNPFSPSVEVIKEGAFLPDFPDKLFSSASPLPCIYGYVEVESVFIGKYIIENIFNPSESVVAKIIQDNFNVSEDQSAVIEKEVYKFYFHQNVPDKSNLEKLFELLTDICFLGFYDSFEFVTNSNVPSYVYQFTHYSDNHFMRKVAWPFVPKITKPLHGEEQRYTLYPKHFEPVPIQHGVNATVQKNMCQLWTNFMKTGNPTSEGIDVEWKQHTPKRPYYLQIDADLKLRDGEISGKRIAFLKNILRGIEIRKT